MQNREVLQKMLAGLENRLQKANQELGKLPRGRLTREKRGNSFIFFHVMNENNKRVRKAITKDLKRIQALARKAFLQKETALLQSNIHQIKKTLAAYRPMSFDDVITTLPQYIAEYAAEKPSAWSDEPYNQSTYMPERKVHTTSRGLKVRSKSELLIAEKLHEHGVEFRYEQILSIGNIDFAPDFTIRTRSGKTIYWEHCGMTNNSQYMNAHKRKLEVYGQAGIFPWKNLIVTYDDECGILDLSVIESEIINKIKKL